VIGDVAGHGLEAAAVMGQFRNALRAYALDGAGPAAAVDRLNRLTRTFEQNDMATLVYGEFDSTVNSLRFVRAGHPPPLVRAPDGTVTGVNGRGSLPVGVAHNSQYEADTLELAPNTTLLLYTDGLVERRNEPIDAGLGRLAAAASDSPGHAGTLASRLVAAIPGSARPDDVAVLVLSRREAAGGSLTVRLPAEATSLGPLRERLRRWLDAEGLDRTEAADVLLAVGEAASNAIEHPLEPAPAAIVVTLARMEGDTVRISIRDHGRWDEQPSAPHRGRGMNIMQAIAGELAIDRTPEGTIVTIHHRKGERVA